MEKNAKVKACMMEDEIMDVGGRTRHVHITRIHVQRVYRAVVSWIVRARCTSDEQGRDKL